MSQSIKGDKVLLRAMEPADIELLYIWENDSEIWRVSNTIVPFSRATLEKYIESAESDIYEIKQLRLMIQSFSSNNETVGAIDIFDFDPVNCRAGVGVLIGEKANRENGYATDALRLLIDYCFGTLNLKQIYCNILTDNTASLSLFEKFNFEKTGLKKSWVRQDGIWKDEYMLQLINRNRI
ncbi:MAG: GNAT family protein [Bacteroidota bacterium]